MSTNLIATTPEVLDKHGAAIYLGIGRRTLDSFMRRRVVPYSRLGGKLIRFKKANLDKVLEQNRVA